MWEHNRFPDWFTIVALTFVVTVAVVRLTLIRSTAAERLINRVVFFATATALLREPAIAERVAPIVPGGLPTLFDLWHALFLIATALFVGVFLMWDLGVAQYRQPLRRTVAIACVVGVILLVLGHPARTAGVSIPDAGGWRYGAYFVGYAGLLVGFCLCNLRPVMTLRRRATSQRETVVVVILFLLVVNGALIMSLMAVGNVMGAAGIENTYTDLAHLGASGEPLLLWVVLYFVALVPSVVRATTQLLRVDRDSRALRRLYPVWRDLTAATPEVVLPLDRAERRGTTHAERLHRRQVEIVDAASIIGRYALPVPDDIDNMIESSVLSEDEQESLRSVLELRTASWRLQAIGGVQHANNPLTDHYSVPDLETLARLWQPASDLIDRATSQGLPCPNERYG